MIRGVRVSGHLVILVLVYVALDLSLAFMPGAFVFEASDSVESVQRGRMQIAESAVALVCDPRESVIVDDAIQRPQVGDHDAAARSPHGHRTGVPRSNQASEPASPSEDSH